ncbi:MAG: substrate-binding domain-containing protein [Frankiaceae bacterium]|nr:substrate-binding domain-containing protein [Frankiaceae bacterium]MBV9872295.1 substrate-binding domain-containing protein [Frankiaceae bacterium]
MKLRALAAVAIAALAAAPGLTAVVPAQAAATHTLIQGSGSSWAANAVNQWVADVHQQGMQVVYSPSGDATGRQDFANKTSDMSVTSLGYQGRDPLTGVPDTSQGRPYAYLPIAAGGTAFPYQLRYAGQQVRNLRLSGSTLVGIFTGTITNWNDKAITADNNGHALPSLPITPVVQSEGSGSTAQLTKYFDSQYKQQWVAFSGRDTFTEYYPNIGKGKGANFIGANGSDQAMNYVSSRQANGSIGYVEYSYALSQNYPVAKLLNKSGYYTLPTQYNVAVALEKAQINMDKSSPNYLLQDLTHVYTDPDVRTYPLSSYVYMIEPTGKYPSPESKITTAKRQTIADFAYYSICQGQKEIGPIGYSPLPVNLVQAGFGQINKLKAADSSVDLTNRNVKTCNNPTFIKGHPNTNYLAKIAPKPPACDKRGNDPCADGVTPTGTDNPQPSSGHKHHTTTPGTNPSSPATSGSGSGSGSGTGAGAGTGPSGTGGAGVGTQVDANGQPLATTGTGSAADAPVTVPAGLAGYRAGHLTKILAPLCVVLLILALVLPPVIAHRMSARRGGPQ